MFIYTQIYIYIYLYIHTNAILVGTPYTLYVKKIVQ